MENWKIPGLRQVRNKRKVSLEHLGPESKEELRGNRATSEAHRSQHEVKLLTKFRASKRKMVVKDCYTCIKEITTHGDRRDREKGVVLFTGK